MKTLKFKNNFVAPILGGSKTVTWRLFDDKDLKVGDLVELVEKETLNKFGEAEIIDTREKALKDLTDSDYQEHGDSSNSEDVVTHFKQFYGDRVNPDTLVKIIKIKLK
jgi:hypothetical protein